MLCPQINECLTVISCVRGADDDHVAAADGDVSGDDDDYYYFVVRYCIEDLLVLFKCDFVIYNFKQLGVKCKNREFVEIDSLHVFRQHLFLVLPQLQFTPPLVHIINSFHTFFLI